MDISELDLKKIAVLIIIVVVTSLIIILLLAPSGQDVPEPVDTDDDIYIEAVLSTDSNLCTDIQDASTKELCYGMVADSAAYEKAVDLRVPALCDKISNEEIRLTCLEMVLS